MPTQTTKQNIITLVSLAFLGDLLNYKDVSTFLGVTPRQAITILNEMKRQGLINQIEHGVYKCVKTTGKGKFVIRNLIENMSVCIEAIKNED